MKEELEKGISGRGSALLRRGSEKEPTTLHSNRLDEKARKGSALTAVSLQADHMS